MEYVIAKMAGKEMIVRFQFVLTPAAIRVFVLKMEGVNVFQDSLVKNANSKLVLTIATTMEIALDKEYAIVILASMEIAVNTRLALITAQEKVFVNLDTVSANLVFREMIVHWFPAKMTVITTVIVLRVFAIAMKDFWELIALYKHV